MGTDKCWNYVDDREVRDQCFDSLMEKYHYRLSTPRPVMNLEQKLSTDTLSTTPAKTTTLTPEFQGNATKENDEKQKFSLADSDLVKKQMSPFSYLESKSVFLWKNPSQ